MKKTLFLILAVFILSFGTAAAQTMPKLDPSTIGDLCSWEQTSLEIMVALANYNLEDSSFTYQGFNDNASNKGFMADHDEGNRRYLYMYYFDVNTDKLKQVEAITIFYSQSDIRPYLNELYENYGFADAQPFHTNFFDQYAASYDLESYEIFANDSTICLIGYTHKNDNAMIVMTFYNKELIFANAVG